MLIIIDSVFFWFCFVLFFWPYLQHMEVPRLGSELELQLPAYTTAMVMWDPSHVCDLHHSSWQCQVLKGGFKISYKRGVPAVTQRKESE